MPGATSLILSREVEQPKISPKMLAPDKHINLLAAFGNITLSDDGASIFVFNKIKKKYPEIADYKDFFYMDANFINDIEGYKNLIIIDTTKTNRIETGDFQLQKLEDFEESFHLKNFHDSSIKEIVDMGKTLNMKMPEKIYIITIEIKENKLFSEKFSEELNESIEKSAESIENIVTEKFDKFKFRE